MPIPLPVIPDTFRCALRWTASGGQTAVNVMHIGTAVSGKTPLQVFTCLDAHVTEAMWDTAGGSASIGSVDITKLDGTSATVTFPTGSPAKWSTAGAGDYVPALAAILKLQTGLRGRNHRGRLFLPFVGEANNVNGAMPTAEATAVTAAWHTFQLAIIADATTSCDLVVASYDRRHAGAGAEATAVSALGMEVTLGTQRRRQGRLR